MRQALPVRLGSGRRAPLRSPGRMPRGFGSAARAAPPPRAAATCERQARACPVGAVWEPSLGLVGTGNAGHPQSGARALQRLHKRERAVFVRPIETAGAGELQDPQAPGPLGPGVEVGPSEETGVRRLRSCWGRAPASVNRLQQSCVHTLDPWLADAWSYCKRREPAGVRPSPGSLPQKVSVWTGAVVFT